MSLFTLRTCSPTRTRRMKGGPREPLSEPTQWVPSPYGTTDLSEVMPYRAKGTGYKWTTSTGSPDVLPPTPTAEAPFSPQSISPLRSSSSSASSLSSTTSTTTLSYDPSSLNGGMSLLKTAKTAGHLHSTPPSVKPEHAEVMVEKYRKHPLQRGGINFW